MTSNARGHSRRILGSLQSADGKGIVRIEDRIDTVIDDLWSALTDPARLARWLGDVDGDLRVGGEFRARFSSSGWEGTGRVEACEAPHRFVVISRDPNEPGEEYLEVTLTADGEQTLLVIDQRQLPLEYLAGYAAGMQIHVEDLAAHIAGRGRSDSSRRFEQLIPEYRNLVAELK